jgi:acetyl esterase/lipase
MRRASSAVSILTGLLITAAGLARAEQRQERPGVTVPDSVVFEEGLEFASPGGERLLLDMARPREKAGPLPAVVCIHGGGFVRGTRHAFQSMCVGLAAEGYVAVTIDYRLAPKYPFPACVEDVKAAVRWLRANAGRYQIDPEHIGATGASAGGHLALMLGLTAEVRRFEGSGGNPDQPSRVSCVVNYFGPTDFTRVYGKSKSEPVLVPFLGGNLQQERPRHIQSSPLNWVTPNAAPTLSIQGTEDDHVPHEQAVWITERLRAAGVEASLLSLGGAGHGFTGPDAEMARSAMLTFFAKHLKSAPGQPAPASTAGDGSPQPPLKPIAALWWAPDGFLDEASEPALNNALVRWNAAGVFDAFPTRILPPTFTDPDDFLARARRLNRVLGDRLILATFPVGKEGWETSNNEPMAERLGRFGVRFDRTRALTQADWLKRLNAGDASTWAWVLEQPMRAALTPERAATSAAEFIEFARGQNRKVVLWLSAMGLTNPALRAVLEKVCAAARDRADYFVWMDLPGVSLETPLEGLLTQVVGLTPRARTVIQWTHNPRLPTRDPTGTRAYIAACQAQGINRFCLFLAPATLDQEPWRGFYGSLRKEPGLGLGGSLDLPGRAVLR